MSEIYAAMKSYAAVLQKIYDERTAGDGTFVGVLAEFVGAVVVPATARAERAEAAIQRAKKARWRLRSVLVAVAPLLEVAYPDAPTQSPWTRFVYPAMAALDAALDGTDNTGGTE